MAKAKNGKAAQVDGFTPSGIVVFPDVFETAKDQAGKDSGKYKLTLLFDVSDPEVKTYVNKVAKASFDLACRNFDCTTKEELDEENIRWNPFLKASPKQIEKWGDVYEGKVFVRSSSKFQPQLVDRRKNAILDPDDFYPGCKARMIFTGLFAYGVDGNMGVSFNLNALQKTAEGERLGGGNQAEGFEALDSNDDKGDDQFEDMLG